MKVMKTVAVPASTREVCDHITCELCGKPTGNNGTFSDTSWVSESFTVAETSVVLVEGCAYPDGGETNYSTLDICNECFRRKLIPWFESQGGLVRTHSVDF